MVGTGMRSFVNDQIIYFESIVDFDRIRVETYRNC